MDRTEEMRLFQDLCRNPRIRKWIDAREQALLKTLKSSVDRDQLVRAQGACGLLDQMVSLLDAAESAEKKAVLR